MMKYRSFSMLAAGLILFSAAASHAGFLSAVRDRIKDGGTQQHQAGEQVGSQQQPQQQPQGTPPPAEQANQPQGKAAKTPTAEEIKEGAKKLQKELNWEQVPGDLFGKYAGTWGGHFWVYTPQGKKEQVQKVRIKYETQGNTMAMTTLSFDMISKQYVTEETATYTVSGDTINVEIKRPTGKTSKQVGHFSDGQVFFQGKIDDGVEHFRERIDGKRLLIDGFGIYESFKSKDHHIFIGRFLREE